MKFLTHLYLDLLWSFIPLQSKELDSHKLDSESSFRKRGVWAHCCCVWGSRKWPRRRLSEALEKTVFPVGQIWCFLNGVLPGWRTAYHLSLVGVGSLRTSVNGIPALLWSCLLLQKFLPAPLFINRQKSSHSSPLLKWWLGLGIKIALVSLLMIITFFLIVEVPWVVWDLVIWSTEKTF